LVGWGLCDWDVHHCTHPNREARDGVAVLLRTQSFRVVAREMVPFDAKSKELQGQHYMCAAVTFAVHTETKLRLAFASVHFYSKKAVDPQATLLEYLKRRSADYDAVVWGGDCNHVYRQAPAGYVWEEASQHRPTRRASGKTIDWIFASRGVSSLQRCATAERLKDASRRVVPETGFSPSDHFAEAVAVTLSCTPVEAAAQSGERNEWQNKGGVAEEIFQGLGNFEWDMKEDNKAEEARGTRGTM
jgi:hypothetical protein